MTEKQVINWLLKGDVSIQYQVFRDLLHTEKKSLKKRIEHEGWGQKFLSFRSKEGHWGKGFYQPKWTCSHYTLLDLKNLGISGNCVPVKKTLDMIVRNEKGNDGGIYPAGVIKVSDVCINGMALNYLSYFGMEEKELVSVIDFLLSQQMKDGGFNCWSNRKGAVHSSLHTTLSVLEGILEYKKSGYTYRIDELLKAAGESEEFILQHRLFKSDKTGMIISNSMLTFAYPCRWQYDILRALDYFQSAGIHYDERMQDAIDILLKKRTKENTWKLPANHPGQFHFYMEKTGQPSRWNTLRALRILQHFGVTG